MRAGKIRVVIIGCGQIAGGYDTPRTSSQQASPARRAREKIRTHAKAYLSDRRFELLAACDKDPKRAKRFCREWGIPRAYTSVSKMLRAERPSVVSVCTPTETHTRILKEVARHPVKLVFAEKPLTGKSADAKRIIALFRRKKISLAVNYLRRWCPNHRRLKQIINSGRLGRLRVVDGYYTGDLLNIGSHLVDLVHFLGGKLNRIGPGGQFRSGSDVMGVLQHGSKDDFILEMLFERGFVKIGKYGYDGYCDTWNRSGKVSRILKFAHARRGIDSAMGEAARNIADHLANRRPLLSGPQNALAVLAVCAALKKSVARKSGWVKVLA